jgi:hypothetical protein
MNRYIIFRHINCFSEVNVTILGAKDFMNVQVLCNPIKDEFQPALVPPNRASLAIPNNPSRPSFHTSLIAFVLAV